LNTIEPYIGTFYSKQWVDKNILRLNEEEIKEMEKEMKQDNYVPMNQLNTMNQDNTLDNTQDTSSEQ
jgi:hypothetical protein